MASNAEKKVHQASTQRTEICTRSRWVTIIVVAVITLVVLLLTVAIVAPLGVQEHDNQVRCANVSGPLTGYTRSGSVARLGIIHDFECIEKNASAHINDQGSVAVYQAPCDTLNTKKFTVNRSSLTYDNVADPMVVLNEDVDDNYFLNGTVEVNVNATFNSSIPTKIYVCLFLDLKTFTDFTNLDKNWRDYVNLSDCRVTTKGQFDTTFDIKSPNFVFIAMATTEHLTTLQFGYNGTAENYGQPSDNMNKVCSLSSDKASESQCSFLLDTNKDVCVLASTEDNADGSIDYISVTLMFTQDRERMVRFVSLTVSIPIVVLVILLFITLAVRHFLSRNHSGYQEIR